MATSSTYYLNAPSLASATAVFSNAGLTTLAADGFYSDGVISREQVGGVLLPQQSCPTCATPCGSTINASGGQGIYLLDLDTGSTSGDIGAVIVRFDPYGVPDGIRGTLGANVYNKLVSSVDGLHESSNAGHLTYVGQAAADCGISGTTYPALLEYSYNGTSFVATGNTQSVTVAPGDVSLGASAPGSCLMVIPKLTPTPSIINFEVVGPCSGTAWSMSVNCPVLLTGFSSSVMAVSDIAVCELTETVTYYNASLANTPGTVGLYDLVFADEYGGTQLAAGYYLATGSITGGNDWFQVDSNGVVIDLGTCATPPPVSYNCVDGTCTDPGDGTGTYSTLESCEAVCSAPTTVQLDWTVGAQSGGQLKVFNSSMTEILSITSSAGGAQSGTIYPLVSELPYTIRGQWASGSGNIIKYNVCDLIGGGTIFTSGAIDNSVGFEDFLASPTPNHALVNLTANNVTPPTCPI